MTSTYLTYRMYAQDLTKSLARTASKPDVAREEKYYQDNIGKVTSVDEFLNDRRLFAYAMKAHGLEDMTYAKAFMRKVLESDLTDAKSFARQLVDSRYAIFANSFSFTTDGNVQLEPALRAERLPGGRHDRPLFRASRQAGRGGRHRGAILPDHASRP